MDSKNIGGDQPAKNHQYAQVPFINTINAKAFDRYVDKRRGCYACPISCSRESTVADGPYAVTSWKGRNTRSTNALGPMCWIADPEAILYANRLCNEYGLDTISTGVTDRLCPGAARAGAARRRAGPAAGMGQCGVAARADRAHRAAPRHRRRAGRRHAPARPSASAAGPSVMPCRSRGWSCPARSRASPRASAWAMPPRNRGPIISTACRPSTWQRRGTWPNGSFPAEIVPELMDPANEKYKPDMVVYGEHFCAVTDALGICKFSTIEEYALFPEDLAPGLAALWGRPVTGADLLAGRRAHRQPGTAVQRPPGVVPHGRSPAGPLYHRAGAALLATKMTRRPAR